MKVKTLTQMALFVALGTMLAHLMWIPVGVVKLYPLQQAINVVAGVLLGPWNAGLVALVIGLLRNILGIGTIFAFPGGIIGAVLAGWLYRWSQRDEMAVVGEVIGTGLLAALVAYPMAKYLLGKAGVTVFYFVLPSA